MQTVMQSRSVIQDLTNIFRNFNLVAIISNFILLLNTWRNRETGTRWKYHLL